MISQSEIRTIIEDNIIGLTKKVANISIKKGRQIELDRQNVYTGMIHTNGAFHSIIVCCMEESFYQEVLTYMTRGTTVDEKMAGLYIGEYLNIICGNIVSHINNKLRIHSRLKIPYVKKGNIESQQISKEQILEEFYFESSVGKMKFHVTYELNVKNHSSIIK